MYLSVNMHRHERTKHSWFRWTFISMTSILQIGTHISVNEAVRENEPLQYDFNIQHFSVNKHLMQGESALWFYAFSSIFTKMQIITIIENFRHFCVFLLIFVHFSIVRFCLDLMRIFHHWQKHSPFLIFNQHK